MFESCHRHWPKNQTLLLKHYEFALQALFDRLATSKNIARQTFFDLLAKESQLAKFKNQNISW